jgi:hypothetical protein
MYNKIYNKTTRKACYIATAVYGDEDAWQVEKLRQFRDNNLNHNLFGLTFVYLYYSISPYLVRFFKNIKLLNTSMRKILDRIVGLI